MAYLRRMGRKSELKSIELPGIGAVTLRKNAQARRLRISIHPAGRVSVTIPYGVSETAAIGFVTEKKEWIEGHLRKIARKKPVVPVFDENTRFTTRFYEVIVRRVSGKGMKYTIGNGKTIVDIPWSTAIADDKAQSFIKKAITETWRAEANAMLPVRLEKLAKQFGFTFSGPAIRNSISRWGSCSSKGSINLSLHLMRLPDHLIDYVLLHELVHTVHHNHGPKFWKLLDEVAGNAKAKRREMRNFSLRDF